MAHVQVDLPSDNQAQETTIWRVTLQVRLKGRDYRDWSEKSMLGAHGDGRLLWISLENHPSVTHITQVLVMDQIDCVLCPTVSLPTDGHV